ncbi:hypothetical protein [Paenibacillus durus]|uniref:hypothetical protein n=1 Tax=Paenibacillus durus TaxID=44251 RepID=UPI0004B4A832|nr:hypothetical protein [Paenibacillus durus]
MLKIEKITDKTEELDVNGQGCLDDCLHYSGYSSSSGGCQAYYDAYVTNFW